MKMFTSIFFTTPSSRNLKMIPQIGVGASQDLQVDIE